MVMLAFTKSKSSYARTDYRLKQYFCYIRRNNHFSCPAFRRFKYSHLFIYRQTRMQRERAQLGNTLRQPVF